MTPEQVEQRKQAAAKQLAVYFEDLRWLMNQKQGRRIIFTLLDEAGIFRPGFYSETTTTYYELGKRDYLLRLHNQITSNWPDLYVLMCKENRKVRLPDIGEEDG